MSAPASRTNARSSVVNLPARATRRPPLVRLGHPPCERGWRDEPAQAGPGLVRRVEQHSARSGARRDVHERAGREARDAVRVGVGDGHDAAAVPLPPAAAPRTAAIVKATRTRHTGRSRRSRPSQTPRPRRRTRRRPSSISASSAASPSAAVTGRAPADGRVNVAQHLLRHRAERAGQRILRVDEISAARERGRCLRGARDAHEQLHRGP